VIPPKQHPKSAPPKHDNTVWFDAARSRSSRAA
jgi:hypothetical protein